MPRGVPHSPELRAQAVAAVLAGATIAQVAAQFKLDKGLVSRWVAQGLQPVATDQRARAREDLGERILTLLDEHITTLVAQLQVAARPEWIEKQNPRDLAELVAVERDTALRLLAGLRPAEPAAVVADPALDSPDGPPESTG
jgi:transposase-like protein